VKYEHRRQDIYAGVLLCALSLGVIAESSRMPRDLQGWPAYASPGVVTGLLALGLLGMALALVIRAIGRSGASVAVSRSEAQAYLADPRTHRLALMFVLSVAYLLALGRGIPYVVTTGAYLLLAMLLFRAAPWWAALLISGVAAAGISLVFNRVFLIPLP
jgi:hypothetical protein